MKNKAIRYATGAIAGSLALAGLAAVAPAAPVEDSNEDRTISFYHIHTKEQATVLYKKNGVFLPDAMKKVSWILRDWRLNEATEMDPNTIDIIWEMHRELGSQQPVHIISGFRSTRTNNMLRRTVGGQAKNSQHITGKAVDIHFPDVPLRRMRYSAMIRERGGVGYYPTSGIPFVHVDTGRVRHWPRMTTPELALIFPSGKTKHGSISLADVKRARERNKDLATEVAQWVDLRNSPKPAYHAPTAVAAASPDLLPPAPRPAQRAPRAEARMSVGGPVTPATPEPATLPKLVSGPRIVDRPVAFRPQPSPADRSRLDMMVTLAGLEGELEKPGSSAAGAPPAAPILAAVDPLSLATAPAALASPRVPERAAAPNYGPIERAAYEQPSEPTDTSGWIPAPEYDDDHPEEMSYRPFPLAPFLTDTSSPDDPALLAMSHPDVEETFESLDADGVALPMRLGAEPHEMAMIWAQEFRGEAVNISTMMARATHAKAPATALNERTVRTSQR